MSAEPGRPARLGILLSGRGSNFLAIADAVHAGILRDQAEIAIVISNVAEAQGLARARGLELPTATFVSKGRKRAEHDADVAACLREYEVDLVILAGYMRLLSPEFIAAFPNRILNIHPSLLPAFPGLDAQTQAFDYGCRIAGCTVHFVDEQLDHGVIVLQRSLAVEDSDDAHTLADRLLEEEHRAYPEAIARVLSGQYRVNGRRYERVSSNAAKSVK
jgi:phosphoribosylglycinamide formyltransferase-1